MRRLRQLHKPVTRVWVAALVPQIHGHVFQGFVNLGFRHIGIRGQQQPDFSCQLWRGKAGAGFGHGVAVHVKPINPLPKISKIYFAVPCAEIRARSVCLQGRNGDRAFKACRVSVQHFLAVISCRANQRNARRYTGIYRISDVFRIGFKRHVHNNPFARYCDLCGHIVQC